MSNSPVLPPSLPAPAAPQARLFPAVPPATDLPSALRAINAMRQIIAVLTGAIPPNNLNNSG